jgi:HD superfamily phosphohydrolase
VKKTKIIKDLVHGYIEIDDLIAEVIDHRSFQRLKNIAQLTCHHLFPSANHTRFEHSLGVMFLAQQFFNRLKPLLTNKLESDKDFFIHFLGFHLKFASLLHDVGHGPFSHLGESFYDEKDIELNIRKLNPNVSDKIFISGSKHELMSCYVIEKNFKGILSEFTSGLDMELDVDFIYRMITGAMYDEHRKYWPRNLMIEILNSSSIDIDKLDYLMRDNLMTGMVAPHIQIDRLIKSLYIDNEYRLTFLPVGVSGLLSVIDARDLLYLWVYNHHTVVYTDFLYHDMVLHLHNLRSSPQISNNGINIGEFFSCSAIAEKYISDDDIRVLLNKEYTSTRSEYSKKVLPQLLERKFLKPLWKTVHEFETYLDDNFDERAKERIIEDISNERVDYRNKISRMIQKHCSIEHGEIFVIKRSNKFYSMSKKSSFYVYYEGKGNISL